MILEGGTRDTRRDGPECHRWMGRGTEAPTAPRGTSSFSSSACPRLPSHPLPPPSLGDDDPVSVCVEHQQSLLLSLVAAGSPLRGLPHTLDRFCCWRCVGSVAGDVWEAALGCACVCLAWLGGAEPPLFNLLFSDSTDSSSDPHTRVLRGQAGNLLYLILKLIFLRKC